MNIRLFKKTLSESHRLELAGVAAEVALDAVVVRELCNLVFAVNYNRLGRAYLLTCGAQGALLRIDPSWF